MHIKQVVLEGFKSYGPRTDIGMFDRHFNAITGLNGSGKSNILDGIIFVLGLSSLNNVRADNLTDLIHKGSSCKRGFASVIFDNTERSGSPIGYEKYEEIIVSRTIEETGQCKYYLNGIVATRKKIVDMFESIQLNISHPNFVIQQGRITKVVNMKPKEFLHMIEETVGATFYQSKRDKTEKDVVDKDPYIVSVRNTLQTIIQPALAKQRKAAQYATEYHSLKNEVNSKSKQFAIAAYGEWSVDLQKTETHLNKLREQEAEEKAQIKEIDDDIVEKKQEIEKIKSENNSRVKEKLTVAEKELGKNKRKYDAVLAQHESAITSEADALDKVKKAEKAFKMESKQVEDFHGNRGAIIAENEAIKQEIEAAQHNLEQARHRESEINAGKVLGDDGKAIDLRERVMALDDEINGIRRTRDHERKILQNDIENLKGKEAELKKTPSDAEIEKKFSAANNEVRRIADHLKKNNISPDDHPTLEAGVQLLKQKLTGLENEKRQLMHSNSRFVFQYTDPEPNFNRKSVHGFLFELFKIKEARFGNVFEIGTASNWTRIIVDNPQVSKALIERGRLPTRVTFHPIAGSQINQSQASQRDLDRKFGPGRVFAAIDLIEYDPKYASIMKTFFGNVVFCEHMEDAKEVAFKLRHKAITMSGEMLESGGTMQGGHRPNVGRFLKECQRFAAVNNQIRAANIELDEATQKLHHYKGFINDIKAHEVATRNLTSLEQLRQCTAFASLSKEIDELKESTAARSQNVNEMDAEVKVKEREFSSCKKKLDSEDETKVKNLKEIKTQIQKYEKELTAAKKKYEAKQKTYNDIETEVQAKKQMLAEYEKDIETAKKELEEAREDIRKKKALLDEENEAYKEKAALVEEITKEYKQCDADINLRENQIKQSQKMKQKLEVGKIKRDNELKTYHQRVQGRRKDIDDLKQKYDTINYDDYENLPKPDESASELRNALAKAQKRLEEMSTKVDQESADKLDTTLHGAKLAEEKSKMVEKNRVHLTRAMEVLDSNKRDIVMKAYHEINKEFGSMMTTLLPEAEAKLVPVNPNDLTEGLSIHVCLGGGSWKESLLELSGGQRSLVALALVLSLCMYKPAPFYILDEVDAALDLSHTQNMGVIIKQRFKGTQFVCVSLKEGMYTNANTLFQVTFNRGLSTVSCQKKLSSGNNAANAAAAARSAQQSKQKPSGQKSRRVVVPGDSDEDEV